jgi:hypothetical protein
MIAKWLVTFGVLLYGAAVPYLEINDTHLWNAAWPAHARLHEAWQLTTNSLLGAWALWLAWGRNQVRPAALLGLAVMGGFLASYLLAPAYGGSMLHADGSERIVLGINIGVLGFGLGSLASLLALAMAKPAGPAQS